MKTRVQALIKGDVKGVFFRMGILSKANLMGVRGWVKNIPEGVEVVFEGDDDVITELLDFCRIGPNGALVKAVETKESPYRGEFTNFEIRGR
ncbi:MAG: acylphosphatase [Candidatus Aenigmatarchaeota archaeon]